MCPGCGRVWTTLHVIWSAMYVTCGAAQLIAAIFFLISVPELHLSGNLWTGSWNILFGIIGGMVACFGETTIRRQEILLYITISITTVNTVNAVLNEWVLYVADIPQILMNHAYHTLINYACYAIRVSAATSVIISFLDSQLAFCSMQSSSIQDKKKLRRSHEQVSDIEYIIPRPKSSTKTQPLTNAYSQSWVFDAENASCSNHADSPYLKVTENDTPKLCKKSNGTMENGVIHETTYVVDNPVVHIEEASDDSTSNSDRKLCYMKSFSRSASPVILSASSSQLSLNVNSASNAPIYECLEKLTEATIYRSRLNSALSNKDEEEPQYQAPQQTVFRRVDCVSPHAEQGQYASLMKELQKAIVNKKEPSVTSPPSNSGSVASDKTQSLSKNSSRHDSSISDTKNSDAEFSKELEAALQLIQDLESPNTIDTPSEPKVSFDGRESKPLAIWRNSDASESEKTLSAVGSLAEITSPFTECQLEFHTFKQSASGKAPCVVVQYCDSQSTSGYSSPTHKSHSHTPNWSATSSISGSNHDIGKSLSYIIHNTTSAAVISLYTQNTLPCKNKSVTLVTIPGNNESLGSLLPLHNSTVIEGNDSRNDDLILHDDNISQIETNTNVDTSKTNTFRKSSVGSPSLWNVKSLLRKKKSSLPKLCPELEGAIIKSESLAYLSELELLARHQRNKNIQRQIEQRVLHQMSSPKSESNC